MNARARAIADSALLDSLTVENARPTTAIIVAIDAVYMHCSSEIVRSGLRDPDLQDARDEVSSAGELIGACAARSTRRPTT